MAINVHLSDEANYVLDEYIIEAGRLKEKGKTASDAVVSALLPQLSDLRQQLVLNRFPDLAAALPTARAIGEKKPRRKPVAA